MARIVYHADCKGARTSTVALLIAMVQNLNMLHKKQIIEELDCCLRSGENASLRPLAEWAQAKFRLPGAPGKAVRSRIFSKSESLRNQPARGLSKKKRSKRGKKLRLEKALFEWICEQHSWHVSINGDMIRQKAVKMQDLVYSIQERKKLHRKLSEEWLHNFKQL